MILDFRNQPWVARLYSIKDAESGETLDHQDIFWADDRVGLYRLFSRDEHNHFRPDHVAKRVACETRARPLRFVPKADLPEADKRLAEAILDGRVKTDSGVFL